MLFEGDAVRKILRLIFRQHDAVEAQQFRHRPGLKRTAARRVRRLGVGDFRYVAETVVP